MYNFGNQMQSYVKKRKKHIIDEPHNLPRGSLLPAQVCKAYGFEKLTPQRKITIGIVSLGGSYSASDMTTAFDFYKLPAPNVRTAGVQAKQETKARVENMLDIDCAGVAFAYSTGQSANLLEQFEPNQELGIPNAINALIDAGCEVISISWGGPADEQSREYIQARARACARAAAANVHIFVASGDNSLDDGTDSRTPDDPCCEPNVWGVGGTRLRLNKDGSIASEFAWGDGNESDDGGGGGFDPKIPKPKFQDGVVPGAFRGIPDSSANADPRSGYAIVANGQWQAIGGTSAAAPLTAGYIAAILASLPGPISHDQLKNTLYANRLKAFNDIIHGSDGEPAVKGWDEATGLGSINGPGLAAVLKGVV